MNILIIEDRIEILRGIIRGLEDRRYQVDVAGSGREAIRKLSSTNHDLIVLDILLPKGEGNEDLDETYKQSYEGQPDVDMSIEKCMGMLIAYKIAEKKITTPVIILSAYVNSDVVVRLKNLEDKGLKIVDILRKPESYERIMDAIELALKTNQQM